MLFLLSQEVKKKIILCGIGLVLAGNICNYIVIVANEGQMPVFVENIPIEARPDLQRSNRHQEATVNTKFAFLGDFILIKSFDSLLSPGDILMAIGLTLLIFSISKDLCAKKNTKFLKNDGKISYTVLGIAMVIPWIIFF